MTHDTIVPVPHKLSSKHPLSSDALELAEALTDVAAQLSNAHSLEELGKVVNNAIDSFLCSSGTICMLHNKDDDWECFSHPPGDNSVIPTDLLKKCLETQDIVTLQASTPNGISFPSVVIAPIRHQAPLGVIGAYWDEVREISEFEEKILKLLSKTVSVALKGLELQITMKALLEERTGALLSVNEELQTFAYTVSHDLKSPLSVVKMNSWTLRELFGPELPEKAQLCVRRLEDAANRMTKQIDGMLAMYRVTKVDLEATEVDLEKMAWSILDDLTENSPSRRCQIIIGENLHAYGDENLLHIVLENLLSNAWKYTTRTTNSLIEFGMTKVKGEPAFFVRDNGVGFDIKHADKLFRIFQRIHSTDDFPGNGIGLASAQRIIHKHGGTIWAESSVDQGATFFFNLPNVPVHLDLEETLQALAIPQTLETGPKRAPSN